MSCEFSKQHWNSTFHDYRQQSVTLTVKYCFNLIVRLAVWKHTVRAWSSEYNGRKHKHSLTGHALPRFLFNLTPSPGLLILYYHRIVLKPTLSLTFLNDNAELSTRYIAKLQLPVLQLFCLDNITWLSHHLSLEFYFQTFSADVLAFNSIHILYWHHR